MIDLIGTHYLEMRAKDKIIYMEGVLLLKMLMIIFAGICFKYLFVLRF